MREEFMAGFREGIDILGRPDHCCSLPESERFWCRRIVSKMPYVHSTSHNACLIHKVESVWATWYEGHYSYMRRLSQPRLSAEAVCGYHVFLSGRKSGKMCKIPDPNAVLCGRCHGEIATFSKHRVVQIKKQWAKDHLGCTGLHQVIGAYQEQAVKETVNG